VRYELAFDIPKDGILHSHRREYLMSHIHYMLRPNWAQSASRRCALSRERRNVEDCHTPKQEDAISKDHELKALIAATYCQLANCGAYIYRPICRH
jgi:hypothetical protein